MHACMLEGMSGPPEPGEISDAQIRKHKGLSRDEFKTEKTKSLRQIRRALIINRLCDFMDTRPPQWFHLSTGYSDPKVRKLCRKLRRQWPWNIASCKWTPGKILMSLRENTWKEFASTHKISIREPHLRMLKLSVEQASFINRRFVDAYKRAMNALGAADNERTTTNDQ